LTWINPRATPATPDCRKGPTIALRKVKGAALGRRDSFRATTAAGDTSMKVPIPVDDSDAARL